MWNGRCGRGSSTPSSPRLRGAPVVRRRAARVGRDRRPSASSCRWRRWAGRSRRVGRRLRLVFVLSNSTREHGLEYRRRGANSARTANRLATEKMWRARGVPPQRGRVVHQSRSIYLDKERNKTRGRELHDAPEVEGAVDSSGRRSGSWSGERWRGCHILCFWSSMGRPNQRLQLRRWHGGRLGRRRAPRGAR